MGHDRVAATVIALGLTAGLLGGSAILGRSLQEMRVGEPFVTVRGVAEKEVVADLAVWPIKVRVPGDKLLEVQQEADLARNKVMAFLVGHGVAPTDIVSQNVRVLDREANDYTPAKGAFRYMIEYTIVVRSTEVEKLKKISQMTDKLVAAGVMLSSQGNWDRTTPQFLFTQLNSIKPTMMAEATRSAREAANQFAADSGNRVGSIKKASQGLFSIVDRDQAAAREGEGGEGASTGSSDLNKKVRVVVTVEYLLEK